MPGNGTLTSEYRSVFMCQPLPEGMLQRCDACRSCRSNGADRHSCKILVLSGGTPSGYLRVYRGLNAYMRLFSLFVLHRFHGIALLFENHVQSSMAADPRSTKRKGAHALPTHLTLSLVSMEIVIHPDSRAGGQCKILVLSGGTPSGYLRVYRGLNAYMRLFSLFVLQLVHQTQHLVAGHSTAILNMAF